MRKIVLTAMCPECDEDMKIVMGDFTDTKDITVSIYSFEQATFNCNSCNKTFITGDIDLLDEDCM